MIYGGNNNPYPPYNNPYPPPGNNPYPPPGGNPYPPPGNNPYPPLGNNPYPPPGNNPYPPPGNNPYPTQNNVDQAGFNPYGSAQNPYNQNPYNQNPYPQPGPYGQQNPYNPYNQNPNPYGQPPPANSYDSYQRPNTFGSFSTPSSTYGPTPGQRPVSLTFDSYSQPPPQQPYNGPGDPYLATPYNPQPYTGPGDPYLVVPYQGNQQPQQPQQPQPYNMPLPNSAPVFYQPPAQYFKDHEISNCQGNKKALLIGINYIGQQFQLRGCINDVKNIKELLITKFGFSDSPENMVILTDDQKNNPYNIPTRKNMINAMKWLVKNCKKGDSLFFHFSGHGSQTKDLDGDEVDGYDETILPVDYKTSGQIVDDEMNAIMVRPLPEGVRLTAIFDSCHSGTALDLPYIYGDDGKLVIQKGPSSVKLLHKTFASIATGDILGTISSVMDLAEVDKLKKNSEKIKKKNEETRSSFADVVMFSGCKDSQTSSDTRIDNQATGAMSYAFIKAVKSKDNLTYLQLLKETRKHLINFSQKPQLSSGRLMDMNQKFIM
ncbi:hypothetical protein BCR32DRAFT_297422 [Anaeromyces robustus]|uniref:Peptidase C14 caspase domain-containing protein n=1 Tax=Anaeromyces robustus TaxID=1754192 RepID=A0A1Y1W850_9FUNG|nr:hypothetical protein BCR32DRAFT_297422 [Anaeromyces robustus]|eukprot:ORX69344.1 hypothetical protein BCR32DRAFT_297422 [Anaeromyces robustus]